ncbi:hypothetical protein E3N88_33713 [Mikania micrantha]|uniref:Uncharacterized protein n=1 Tax=Mikania micrantha TaxID=192012 RepID=A0A5N6MCL7_9ASTR|nr:hypothetical protein E3N88_33713 [Mikania micrantha]
MYAVPKAHPLDVHPVPYAASYLRIQVRKVSTQWLSSKYLEMVMKSSWRSLGCFWTTGSSTNMKMVMVGGGLGSHQASILQALSFKMINNGFLEV